ncbi:hypothetical protein [Paenibacillus sp. GCM10027626]|uniref:hypothetical protein n=1 Tax=Paenibacillus sp. GCM10027626 TaxID=3273411 RepID=UPI003643C71B
MKKIGYLVTGVAIGCVLSIGVSVSAASIKSMIGQKIQAEVPVTINNKALSQDAIIVNNTSYIPLRVASNEVGLKVNSANNKGISLSGDSGAKGGTSVTTTMDKTQAKTELNKVNSEIDKLNKALAEETEILELTKENLKGVKENYEQAKKYHEENYPNQPFEESDRYKVTSGSVKSVEGLAKSTENDIKSIQNQLAELEKKKAELEKIVNS